VAMRSGGSVILLVGVALIKCYATRTGDGCALLSVHETMAECRALAKEYRKFDTRALNVTGLPVMVSYRCVARNQQQKASNWLARTWRSIRKRTGLNIELRQFRSGYINVADGAGMTLEQIAGINGHPSVRTVKRHYLIV
jgi:hypothetical protein